LGLLFFVQDNRHVPKNFMDVFVERFAFLFAWNPFRRGKADAGAIKMTSGFHSEGRHLCRLHSVRHRAIGKIITIRINRVLFRKYYYKTVFRQTILHVL